MEFVVRKPNEAPYQLNELQTRGAMWLYSRQSAILGDEVGTGKTEQLVVASAIRTKDKNLWDSKLGSGKILLFTLSSIVPQLTERVIQITGASPDQITNHPDQITPQTKWVILSYGLFNTNSKRKQIQSTSDENDNDDYAVGSGCGI